MPGLRFEKLGRIHKRKEFDSGNEDLNDFLQKFARQNAKNHLGETYVLVNDANDILGFYTISTASIEFNSYPDRKGLPGYAIPAALIGRLAVDVRYRGKGYGSILLVDALKRITNLSEQIGLHCITVDAKNENAKKFYLKFGFEELLDNRRHLFISVRKVKNSFGGAGE